MSIMDRIAKNAVFRALLNVQSVVMVITTILAAGIVFVGVFMRYVLKSNFFGQEEILCVIAMWLYWAAFTAAMRILTSRVICCLLHFDLQKQKKGLNCSLWVSVLPLRLYSASGVSIIWHLT